MKINGTSCYIILIKEQFREYLTLFWNVLAPTIAFVALNIDAIRLGKEFQSQSVLPYLGFSLLSITLYSFGVLLLTRREEGFFSSVTQTNQAKLRFLLLQLASIYTILVASVLLLLFIFGLTVGQVSMTEGLSYIAKATLAFAVLSALSIVINCLPITQKSAYSLASFVTMLAVLGYYFTLKSGINSDAWTQHATLLNPLTYSIYVLKNGFNSSSIIITTGIFVVIGAVSAKYFRVTPSFRRA